MIGIKTEVNKFMTFENVKHSTIKQIVLNGFYYCNKYAQVEHMRSAHITSLRVIGYHLGEKHAFAWSDMNHKWFVNEIDAKRARLKYKQSLPVSISTIRKIMAYIHRNPKVPTIYFLDKNKHINQEDRCDVDGSCYYSTEDACLYIGYEYDDDYCGGTEYVEYKLKDYKKTWAFDKKDLPHAVSE